VPITGGGGIRNISDIKETLINGADRVSINTAAVNDKKFIKESVKVFGSSTITITIESLKVGEKYKVYTDSGRTETNIDVFEWIKEVQDMGVGEIILTSINNEGTGKGFDLNLYEKATKICNISLLAHGGTRNSDDIYKLFISTDIDGAIIASAFHYNYYKELLNKKKISLRGSTNFLVNQDFKNIFFFGVKDLKKYLKSKNINIR
jgi:cyclase